MLSLNENVVFNSLCQPYFNLIPRMNGLWIKNAKSNFKKNILLGGSFSLERNNYKEKLTLCFGKAIKPYSRGDYPKSLEG